MSMSPREIAIMRLQRTVTPPSLRGEAPAPQPQVADPAAEPEGYKKFYQQTWYKVLVGAVVVGGGVYAYNRYARGSSNSDGFRAWLKEIDDHLNNFGFGHEEYPLPEWERLYEAGVSTSDAIEYLAGSEFV